MDRWRWPTPKEVVIGIALVWSLLLIRNTWEWALAPPTVASKTYAHAWKIQGRTRYADHLTSTAPGYMGIPGCTVNGHDEDGEIIWSVSGVTSCEKVR